jgi:hypothetical protein
MPFEKGDPNINRNGRPKGSRNKIKMEIEEQFANVLENKLDKVELWLQQTAHENPAKALELLMKLSERFLPALNRTEVTAKDGEDLFKNVRFKFGGEEEESNE